MSNTPPPSTVHRNMVRLDFNKSDKNKSGTLNLKEFEAKLETIKWYRISRKTPDEWHAEFDANSDGALNKQEFVAFLGSSAHIDTFLKRADKDKSGGISVEELAASSKPSWKNSHPAIPCKMNRPRRSGIDP